MNKLLEAKFKWINKKLPRIVANIFIVLYKIVGYWIMQFDVCLYLAEICSFVWYMMMMESLKFIYFFFRFLNISSRNTVSLCNILNSCSKRRRKKKQVKELDNSIISVLYLSSWKSADLKRKFWCLMSIGIVFNTVQTFCFVMQEKKKIFN